MSLDAWIEAARERFEVPGLAVGVIHDGKVVLSQGFGLRDVEEKAPVTPDTAFAIASVTKAFTAATVGALVDDGLLEWDRPVREYLQNFQMYDHTATELITARDLLCHRSGLPRHDVIWYGTEKLTREGLVRSLRYLQPNKSFRSTWQYNNLMYVTAGNLCEVVTGETWEDLVSRRLFDRARMGSSSFSHEDSGKGGEVARPYAKRKGEVVRIPYLFAKDVAGPAGSIYSTLADMLNWLRISLDDGRLDDEQVLSADTVSQLLAPQMVAGGAETQSYFPEMSTNAYGLGWFIGNYRGHKWVHHGGNTDGFTSLVAMLPEDKLGVVILSNRQATLIRAAISWHIFDEVLGLEPRPWDERLDNLQRSVESGAKQAKARAESVSDTSPSHSLEDYAGKYEHPAYGSFEIEFKDGRLEPRFRELKIEMIHRHYDVFNLELEEAEDAQLTASFATGTDGAISSVSIPLEPSVDPIVFTRLAEGPSQEIYGALAGVYEMESLKVTVEFNPPDRLVIQAPGFGTFKLLPRGGTTFQVEGAQGASAAFALDDQVRVTELVLQPLGIFHPKP